MKIINIAVLCPSNVAYQRFMPSLQKSRNFKYIGIAFANRSERNEENFIESKILENINNQKIFAERFVEKYGGDLFTSYTSLIENPIIDAIYIPLPPALHYKWAKKAIECGKHVLLEKPFTTKIIHTRELIELAKDNNLALHENYMFVFHKQLAFIDDLIKKKEIGDLRNIRLDFGFPLRKKSDFRYNESLGGGSLFDAGGYPIKLALILLGEGTKVVTSKLIFNKELNIDLYGSATLENNYGEIAQISFGMDNEYQCSIKIWGSKGLIIADRVFTAPRDLSVQINIIRNGIREIYEIDKDDHFLNSIEYFHQCITDIDIRLLSYENILNQQNIVEVIYNQNIQIDIEEQ